MKIYMNKPKYNWVSPYTIKQWFFFWKKDYDAYKNQPPILLTKLCELWLRVMNKLNRDISYVKIDYWDIWSMDSTLSPIILPMLKMLKENKHGAPFVHDDDVPYGLRSFNGKPKENECDTDDFHFDRWDWVLDEMIWAFEQLQPGCDWEGLYYWGECDFVREISEGSGGIGLKQGPNHTRGCDMKNLRAHCDRIKRGTTLFGKYYQCLWD